MYFVIAKMYKKTKNYAKSAESFEKALKNYIKVYGEESIGAIQVYIRLAKINSKLGNDQKSLELVRRVLELSNKKNYQDSDKLPSYANLIRVYTQQHYKKVREFLSVAVSVSEKLLGTDNPEFSSLSFYAR